MPAPESSVGQLSSSLSGKLAAEDDETSLDDAFVPSPGEQPEESSMEDTSPLLGIVSKRSLSKEEALGGGGGFGRADGERVGPWSVVGRKDGGRETEETDDSLSSTVAMPDDDTRVQLNAKRVLDGEPLSGMETTTRRNSMKAFYTKKATKCNALC